MLRSPGTLSGISSSTCNSSSSSRAPAGVGPHLRSSIREEFGEYSLGFSYSEEQGRLLKHRHRSSLARRGVKLAFPEETRDDPILNSTGGSLTTPGWQPKETSPNCRSMTPRSRGVGTLGVTVPVTTSLRGLWVSGTPSPGNDRRSKPEDRGVGCPS